MKKITFVAIMAIAAVTLGSCGKASAPKANLKNDIDSVSYALGAMQGNRYYQQNALQQMEVDSAYINDVLRGINDVVSASDNKREIAYFIGANIGLSIVKGMLPQMEQGIFEGDSAKHLSKGDFEAAFIEALTGKDLKIAVESADSLIDAFQQKQRELQYGENRKNGEEFMAKKAQEEGVIATGSGLLYKVLTEGKGAVVGEGEQVKVEYEGRLIDGTVFDSTEKHGGEAAVFGPGNVISGFGEALKLMPVGSEWEIYIPQELAYGEGGAREIKPYSTLIFKVKLLDIVK